MTKADISILVVDDVPEMRSFLTGCLKHMGFFKVSQAKDGVDALQLINKNHFDMIFLDIEMPKVKGLEVLQQIRQNNDAVFITMLSCHSSLGNVKDAIASGANGFVVKPFSAEKIKESLVHFAKHYKALKSADDEAP